MPGPPVIRCLEAELRERFNGARYWDRTLAGEFVSRPFGRQSVYQNPEGSEHPEPEGTLSGLISIIDPTTDHEMARAHRLLRPDGTIGASGLPDPKIVWIDGVLYLQMRKRDRGASGLAEDAQGQ